MSVPPDAFKRLQGLLQGGHNGTIRFDLLTDDRSRTFSLLQLAADALDQRHQFPRVKRLREVVIQIALFGHRRKNYDRNISGDSIVAYSFQQFEPIQFRHHRIGNDDIGQVCLHPELRFFHARCRVYLEASAIEIDLHQPDDHPLVIHHEYAPR